MFVESVKGKQELPPLLGVCVMEECLNSQLPCGVRVLVRERGNALVGIQKLCYNGLISSSCRTDAADRERVARVKMQAALR